MKYSTLLLFFIVFFSGCAAPERGQLQNVLSRIHANTDGIKNGYVRSDSDKMRIWYIGSDLDRHYFGEYRPSKPRIFSDEIVFTFLIKDEVSVQKEQVLFDRLGHGCSLDDTANGSWKWPVESIQGSEFKEKQVVVTEVGSR
jgi:hypothetical protein